MCGSFRPRGSRRTTCAGEQAQPVGALVLDGALEEQLHAEAQPDDRLARPARACAPPRRGRARAAAASPRETRRRPARRARRPRAARRDRRSARSAFRRARRPWRPSAGCPSRSRPSRSRSSRARHPVSVPFVEGTPLSVGIDRDRRAQRAGERLEGRLDHVVRVRARLDLEVQRQARVAGDGAEELLEQLVLEAAGLARRAGRRRPAPRTRGRRRRSRTSRAPRPSARPRGRSGRSRARSPSAASSAWPKHDPDVLDGVMRAGLQVALGVDLEVQAPVAREQVEHVVQEADAGLAAAGAAAVEPELERDVGLAGAALALGGAGGRRSSRPHSPPRAPPSTRRAR